MIRMALFGLGFVAITVALLVIQPGSQRRMPDETRSEPVTRDTPAVLGEELDAGAPDPLPALAAPQISRPVPEVPRMALAPDPSVQLDESEMRRMTWETLSNLNSATGRDSAPGQPGSLLHTIVRRSLDGPAPGTVVGRDTGGVRSGVYIVREGDTLVSIAEDLYGDVNMTGPLFAANQAILTRPDDLRSGQTLVLPGF